MFLHTQTCLASVPTGTCHHGCVCHLFRLCLRCRSRFPWLLPHIAQHKFCTCACVQALHTSTSVGFQEKSTSYDVETTMHMIVSSHLNKTFLWSAAPSCRIKSLRHFFLRLTRLQQSKCIQWWRNPVAYTIMALSKCLPLTGSKLAELMQICSSGCCMCPDFHFENVLPLFANQKPFRVVFIFTWLPVR